jgi:4-amino-4-deoxy-L-arabinose transferase-like glycosyltransferase
MKCQRRESGNPKLWILVGLTAGLGILNKHSMLFFVSGIALGLLATSARKHFGQPWIWLGVGIAFLCFLPNLLWEIHNGWPTLALFHAVMGTKYVIVSPWEYIWQQALLTHPLAAPIWVAGLYFFAARSARKKICRAGLGVFHCSGGDACASRKDLLPRTSVHSAARSWFSLD